MAWNKPATWFKKPEPTGTIYVTPDEAKSIPASTKATVVVAPSGTGAGSMATAVKTGGTTIRRGTGGGSSTPADASFTSGGSSSGEGGTITNTATNAGETNQANAGITQGTTGGLPIALTKQEAEQYKGRDPYWTILSPNTSPGMGEMINTESKYAGAYQPIKYKNILGTPQGVSIINTASKTELQEQYHQEVGVVRAERAFNLDYTKGIEDFNKNPLSFEGKPGFSQVQTDTGITYSLSPEYFTSLPSYQNYQGKIQGYQTFVSTNYPLNEAGQNVISQDYQNSLISQAKTLYEFKVSTGERVTGIFSEYLLSGQKLGAGIVSGTSKYVSYLGQQQFTKEEGLGGTKRPIISFDVSAVPTTPSSYSFLKQPKEYLVEAFTERPATAVFVPATVGAISYMGSSLITNVGKYGFATGTAETLSYFSPLRIGSGGYALKGEPYNVKYDVTKTGGRTFKVDFTGTSRGTHYSEGVFGEGTLSIPKSSLSGTQTFIQSPSGLITTGAGGLKVVNPTVNYIGGNFYYGQVTTQYTTFGTANLLQGTTGYLRFNAPTDFTGINLRTSQGTGFLSDTAYRQTLQTWVMKGPKGYSGVISANTYADTGGTWNRVRGAGVKRDVNPETFTFKSGVREYTYGTDITDTGWVYYPKKIGFKIDIYGRGSFVDKSIAGKDVVYDIGSIGKRSYTTTEQIFQTRATQGGISTENLNQIVSAGSGTIQAGISNQILLPAIETKLIPIFTVSTTQVTKQQNRLLGVNIRDMAGTLKTQQIVIPRTIQTPISSSANATNTTQEKDLYINIPDVIPPPFVPINPTIPTGWGGGGIIIPNFPAFGFDMGSTTRKYKGKRKYKYTPSYESFALGIYGKAPKGLETGARIRPITKGFSLGGGTPTAFMSGFGNFGNRFKSAFNLNSGRRKKKR